MDQSFIRKSVVSTFIVIALTTMGFIGILVFEGMMDGGSVEAITTLYVGGSGLGNYSKIQDAINNANNGDIIRVSAGTYFENVVINKKVSLIGNSSLNTTIDGSGTGDVVSITADWAEVSGFKINNSGKNQEPVCDAGIELNNVENVTITDNNFTNNEYGIFLRSSNYNTLDNNNCYTNNFTGIMLYYCDLNTITNNTSEINIRHGIYIFNSNSNKLINNSFNWNNRSGIYVDFDSNSNDIINNECSNCTWGIYITGYRLNCRFNTIENNTCNTNWWHGIVVRYSDNNNIINNICNINWACSINIDHSNNNNIINNSCNSNKMGLRINESINNKIKNNICNYNIGESYSCGIYLRTSSSNIIEKNVCNSNDISGIRVEYSESVVIENNSIINTDHGEGVGLALSSSTIVKNNIMSSCGMIIIGYESHEWNTHTIESSNTVNSKPICYWKNRNGEIISEDVGQVILANCNNIHIERDFTTRQICPVLLGFSSWNKIINCSLVNCGVSMWLTSSENNTIANNHCDSNFFDGLWFYSSDWNTITNNTFNLNHQCGIDFDLSHYNTIDNNNISINNKSGIILKNSKSNKIINNNISSNGINGIFLNESSNSNIISNNDISLNKEHGIYIKKSDINSIYNNNIINNIIQAEETIDSYSNEWDYYNSLGNYWSDYSGLDNGANGRIANDGIGDTDIPHLGLDNYPIINRSGWLYPGLPVLLDPGEFCPDGNFCVSWLPNRGTTKFVLEEDTNFNLDSAKVIYDGPKLTCNIMNQPNGTYYYRLKAYNEHYESSWSNIVDITVDWPPNIPENFSVSVYSGGNTLNISWEPNPIDTKEYDLYSRIWTTKTWHRIGIITHPNHTFNHTGLLDGEKYFYKIKARDFRNQESNFSKIINAIPADSMAPTPPTELSIVSVTYNSIALKWEPSVEDDVEGYNIYRGNISDPSKWGDLIATMVRGNYTYTDSNLNELTIYYYAITAFDEVPNESDYSNIISGITKLGQHGPEVNSSLDDFEIFEDTTDNTTINLYQWFKDVNGDVLTFYCEGNEHINVSIFQETGVVILRPEKNWNGQETITFYASDNKYEFSDDVTITVTQVNDPPEYPEIILPVDGLEITEGKRLDFESRCSDPDIPYGDKLKFYWSSDISGNLGVGNKLTDIKLPVGKHEITLTVKDNFGNSSYATINVTILKADSLLFEILLTNMNMVIMLILIILLIILFILLKRRKDKRSTKEETFDFEDFSEDIGLSLDDHFKPSPGSTGGQLLPTKQRSISYRSKETFSKPITELSSVFEKPVQQSIITPPKKPIISYQSKMIGRETEMNELKGYLERGIYGHGNTIFIFGEAGIGKTRLVNEVKQVGEARGFQILSSNCVYESLTPYMPIIEALKSGGLDYLFAEEAPTIEAVFLVSNSGLLIKEVIRQETKLNPDIFASMLTTVGNFVKDSLSILSGELKEGALNTLGFENYRIIIESERSLNLIVLLTGKENEFLINDMKEISQYMDRNYGDFIDNWDGDVTKLENIEEHLKPLITSRKYDGMYYNEIDPKVRRDLLFENISMGLIRKSEKTPLLVCIEDLQWSDPSSLALIDYISRNSRNSRLVIICTYRPEEISKPDGTTHHLTEMLQIMDHEDLFMKMELSRLPKENICEIFISILGGSDCNDDVTNLIYRETEGNPLFIIQLVKYLVEEKIILHHKGTWKLAKKVEELNIPPKIYQVISRRLERLGRKTREVLEYASVIGETFSSTILVKALKIPRLKLLARLRDLEQKHRLIYPNNGDYRFDHAKIKEVVYSNIPNELRIEYHSIIANTIKKLNKDNLDTVIEDLAFHYYQSKNKKKAYYYLLIAAEKAKKNYSIKEAIRFYNEALELEKVPWKKRDILDSIGEVYDTIGDYENSLIAFNDAIALTKNPKMLADIKAKIGLIYLKKGDYDTSLRYSTESLKLVKNKNSKEEAAALETIGYTYHRIGEFQKALKYQRKSLEIREKLSDQKGIATSYKNLGMVLAERGDYRNALKNFTNSLRIFRQLRNVQGIQDCLNNLGNLYFNKGEYKKAFKNFQQSLKIVENTGDQNNIAIHLLNIGHSLILIGEPDKALKNLNKSLMISKNNNLQTVIACNYWVMAEAYIEKRKPNKALDYCNLAFELAQKIDNKEIIASLRRVFGIIYKNQKKWKLSIQNFKESIKILKEIGNEQELGDSYYEYGLMWSSKSDSQLAKNNLTEAIRIFKKLKLDKKLVQVKGVLKRL